jgi:hypothetical protein
LGTFSARSMAAAVFHTDLAGPLTEVAHAVPRVMPQMERLAVLEAEGLTGLQGVPQAGQERPGSGSLRGGPYRGRALTTASAWQIPTSGVPQPSQALLDLRPPLLGLDSAVRPLRSKLTVCSGDGHGRFRRRHTIRPPPPASDRNDAADFHGGSPPITPSSRVMGGKICRWPATLRQHVGAGSSDSRPAQEFRRRVEEGNPGFPPKRSTVSVWRDYCTDAQRPT